MFSRISNGLAVGLTMVYVQNALVVKPQRMNGRKLEQRDRDAACKMSKVRTIGKCKHRTDDYYCRKFGRMCQWHRMIIEYLPEESCVYLKREQALAFLREELKHKTCMCMDCGKVIKVTEQSKHLEECPKEPCRVLTQAEEEELYKDFPSHTHKQVCKPEEPEASEFTRRIREAKIKKIVHSGTWLENTLLVACDIIDRQAALDHYQQKQIKDYEEYIESQAQTIKDLTAKLKEKQDAH